MTPSDLLSIYSSDSHIRPVDIRKDLDDIANLIDLCFSETMDEDGRAYLRQLRKSAEEAKRLGWAVGLVEENIIPISGFVWVENDRIIGNLTLIPMQKQDKPIHLVANVAVLPEYRRVGIGKKLTQAAIDYVQDKKSGSIWLQVRDDNIAAEQLYRNLGFVERARRTTWHSYTGDPKPAVIPGYDITSCWPVDWQKEIQYLENIYPPIVQWNLPVNFLKFKPTFLSQVAKVLLGKSYRNWALRKNGELIGVLIWEEARTWADNLWVGCKPEYKETVLNILLPHAMSILNRKQPQALNYPAGEVEQVLSRYGFQKHITLIWMELVESKQNNSHILASI